MALVLPTMLISLKFVFDSFTYILYALLSKKLEFNFIGKAKLFGALFTITLTIILAVLGFPYWALIIPLVLVPIVQFLYLKSRVSMKFRLYNWKATKRTLYRITTLMGILSANNFINYWAGNADKVVIGRLYTQADLGLYNRAYRFITLTNKLVTGIFSTVLFPSLKNLIDKKGAVEKEYLDIIRILTLLNLTVVFILVIFPEDLVRILWGENWIGVYKFLPYVGIILIFKSVVSTISSVYILYRKKDHVHYKFDQQHPNSYFSDSRRFDINDACNHSSYTWIHIYPNQYIFRFIFCMQF